MNLMDCEDQGLQHVWGLDLFANGEVMRGCTQCSCFEVESYDLPATTDPADIEAWLTR